MTSSGPRWWMWLSGLSIKRILMIGVTALVLVSGLFGGLRRAPDPAPPVLEAGEPTTAGPFELTVERVRWVDDLGETAPAPSGRFLAVVATVENTTDRSVGVGVLQQVIEPRDVDGLFTSVGSSRLAESPAAAAEEVLVIADSSKLTTFAPGLAYEVVVLYDQHDWIEAPRSMGLQLSTLTYRRSAIDDQMLWTDAVAGAVGRFDVREGS